MLCSGPLGALAAFPDVTGTRFAAAAAYLQSLGVLVGDRDGNLYPLRTITRAEAAKIIVSLLGRVDQALAPVPAAFPDTAGHWANGYIAVAKNLGIIHGFPDGIFAPQSAVTYVQMAKMLVEAAGLGPQIGLTWPDSYMFVAVTRGLMTGIPVYHADTAALRGDCVMMTAHTVQSVADPASGKTLAQAVFGRAATIELTPATAITRTGAPLTLQAVLRDAAGKALPGLPVGFSVTDRHNARLSQTGVFEAAASGVYTVVATGAGLTASATITVSATAAGLKATPATQTVTATGKTKAEILIEVVGPAGDRLTGHAPVQVTMSHATGGNNGAVTLGSTTATTNNGVAAFEVTSRTTAGRTDTLLFEAPGLVAAQATVSTVAPVATAILVTAEPAQVPVNAVTATTVTATVVDQSGVARPVSGTPLTFSLSGPGTWQGGATADQIRNTTSAGSATISVYSVQGTPGTMVVTVTASGLASGQVQIPTYIAAAPAGLRVDVADDTLLAGVTSTAGNVARLQVALVDAEDRPTSRSQVVNVSVVLADGAALSTVGLAATGDLTIDPGHTRTGDLLIRAANSSSGKAGVHTLRVQADGGTLASAPFTVTVLPGALGSLRLSITEAAKIAIGDPTAPVTVQLADVAGNSLPLVGVEIRAGWQDPSPANTGKPSINGVFNPPADPNATNSVRLQTGADGTAAFNFAAQPYLNDDYRLVFRTGSISVTSPTITVVTFTAAATELRVTNEGGATISRLHANHGETAHLGATVKDAYGNPMGGWDVELVLGDGGRNIQGVAIEGGTVVKSYSAGKVTLRTINSPGSPTHGTVRLSFAGALAGSFTITARPLNAAPGAVTSRGFRIDVGTAVAGVRVTRPDGTAATGLSVQGDVPIELRLVAVDHGGNPLPAPGDVAVLVHQTSGIYSSTGAGEFRTAPASISLPQGGHITIPRGSPWISLYYVQRTAQTGITIAVRATAAAYTAYQLVPVTAALTAPGADSATVTFALTDGSGNPLAGARLSFAASPGTTSPAETFTGADGRATVTWNGGAGGTLRAAVKAGLRGDGSPIEAQQSWPGP